MIAAHVVGGGGEVVDEYLGALAVGDERFFLNVWFKGLTLGVDVVEEQSLALTRRLTCALGSSSSDMVTRLRGEGREGVRMVAARRARDALETRADERSRAFGDWSIS